MKYFIFSDTHFTKKFDKKRFEYLKNKIESVDYVIINGDFWDCLIINFDDFINSEWNKLFPYLKSKHTVYIYGNHDPKHLMDERIYLFCDMACDFIDLNINGINYHISHGDQYLKTRVRYKDRIENVSKTLSKFGEKLGSISQKIYINIFGNHFLPKSFHQFLPDFEQNFSYIDKYLVLGHTHVPHFDHNNKYINTGYINHGYATYLLIDDLGKPNFIDEKYR